MRSVLENVRLNFMFDKISNELYRWFGLYISELDSNVYDFDYYKIAMGSGKGAMLPEFDIPNSKSLFVIRSLKENLKTYDMNILVDFESNKFYLSSNNEDFMVIFLDIEIEGSEIKSIVLYSVSTLIPYHFMLVEVSMMNENQEDIMFRVYKTYERQDLTFGESYDVNFFGVPQVKMFCDRDGNIFNKEFYYSNSIKKANEVNQVIDWVIFNDIEVDFFGDIKYDEDIMAFNMKFGGDLWE